MDTNKSGTALVLNLAHNIAIFAWAGVSTVVYGTIILLVCLFSNPLARAIAHLWCIHLLTVCGVRVNTRGLEKIHGVDRCVFIVNHQSYFDIPVLYAGLPYALSFIAKKELFFIPFFGWGIAAIGHIWIDRENARAARSSISRAIAMLKRKNISLVLFPEGTRSMTGEVGSFRRGSFTVALEAMVPVIPVSIRGTRDILPKKSGLVRPGKATLVIGDPVLPAQLSGLDKPALSAIVKERIVLGITGGRAA